MQRESLKLFRQAKFDRRNSTQHELVSHQLQIRYTNCKRNKNSDAILFTNGINGVPIQFSVLTSVKFAMSLFLVCAYRVHFHFFYFFFVVVSILLLSRTRSVNRFANLFRIEIPTAKTEATVRKYCEKQNKNIKHRK